MLKLYRYEALGLAPGAGFTRQLIKAYVYAISQNAARAKVLAQFDRPEDVQVRFLSTRGLGPVVGEYDDDKHATYTVRVRSFRARVRSYNGGQVLSIADIRYARGLRPVRNDVHTKRAMDTAYAVVEAFCAARRATV